jgi:hypothetical protein
MNRLLRVTSRAYPATGRAELVDALQETYGDAIPFRESVRVLTNGLQLKTQQEFGGRNDVLTNSFVALSIGMMPAKNAWALVKHSLIQMHWIVALVWVLVPVAWSIAVLARRLTIARVLGVLLFVPPLGRIPRDFEITAILQLSLIPIIFLGLTFMPVFRHRFKCLTLLYGLLGFAALKLPKRSLLGQIDDNRLTFAVTILMSLPAVLIPILVLRNDKKSNVIRRLPMWFPLALCMASVVATSSGGGGTLTTAANIAALCLLVLSVVLAPTRPVFVAMLCWFTLGALFASMVELATYLVPGALLLTGAASIPILFMAHHRTKRLLLA